MTWESDEALAARLATAAGDILIDLQARGDLDGKALGAAGDSAANALLCRELKAARPADGLLSEEEKDNPSRCAKSRVWIVDPLDGTREYGERRTDWAVHVALAIDGVATVGAVALPGLGITLTSGAPVPLRLANSPLKMLVSRTRPAAEAVHVAERLGADLLPLGSARPKAEAGVVGKADICLHSGGQYEWDNCAPAAVAQAAGLHVSRANGSPLHYNNRDPYLPDLLICRKELAGQVLRLTAEFKAA